MNFAFETQYTPKAMAVMSKALRKTTRKKRNLRSHIFGWIVLALSILLLLSADIAFDFRTISTSLAILIILIVILFEDRINGYIAYKQLMPNAGTAVSEFSEDNFVSFTGIGKTEWLYKNIVAIAENVDYFVFLYSQNHAQLYDKRSMQGGTIDKFRELISTKTGKQIVQIK